MFQKIKKKILIRAVRDDGIISWEIRLDVLIMSDYEVSIYVMDSLEIKCFLRIYDFHMWLQSIGFSE